MTGQSHLISVSHALRFRSGPSLGRVLPPPSSLWPRLSHAASSAGPLSSPPINHRAHHQLPLTHLHFLSSSTVRTYLFICFPLLSCPPAPPYGYPPVSFMECVHVVHPSVSSPRSASNSGLSNSGMDLGRSIQYGRIQP